MGKQTFKCPKCGHSIKRILTTKTDNHGMEYTTISEPKCVGCGVRYIIKINSDLTYEIEDEWDVNENARITQLL